MKRTPISLVLAAVAGLFLAACSGGSNEPATTTPTTPTTMSPSPTGAAGTTTSTTGGPVTTGGAASAFVTLSECVGKAVQAAVAAPDESGGYSSLQGGGDTCLGQVAGLSADAIACAQNSWNAAIGDYQPSDIESQYQSASSPFWRDFVSKAQGRCNAAHLAEIESTLGLTG